MISTGIMVNCKNPDCGEEKSVRLYQSGDCENCSYCDAAHEGYEFPDGRYWFTPAEDGS